MKIKIKMLETRPYGNYILEKDGTYDFPWGVGQTFIDLGSAEEIDVDIEAGFVEELDTYHTEFKFSDTKTTVSPVKKSPKKGKKKIGRPRKIKKVD